MKRNICDLLGQEITHKKFGSCEVVEIIDSASFKFKALIKETGDLKTLIFSTKFFDVEGEFESAEFADTERVKKFRPSKPVDYSKYRNHPLVKEIDRREAGLRPMRTSDNESQDEESESA